MISKPVCKHYYKWAILWRSDCRLDGKVRSFMGEPTRGMSLLFRTRTEARAYRDKHWGYIKTRPDLKAEPHGWKLPQVVKVHVIIEEVG